MPDITERQDAPLVSADEADHRRRIAQRANAGFPHDGTKRMTAPVKHKEYAVASLPTASLWQGSSIMVTDETGGYTMAYSDGTNWRRVQDRAIVA